VVGEWIFGSRRPDHRQPSVADVWRAEVEAVTAEVGRKNDLRIAALVQRLVMR
jgi:hypothetical protein